MSTLPETKGKDPIIVSADSTFPFLNLPSEIRCMIYHEIFVPSNRPWGNLSFHMLQSQKPLQSRITTNMLCVCRQIYEEASHILYKDNTFTLGYPLHDFILDERFAACLHRIHKLSIRIIFDDRETRTWSPEDCSFYPGALSIRTNNRDNMLKLMPQLISLKSLALDFDQEYLLDFGEPHIRIAVLQCILMEIVNPLPHAVKVQILLKEINQSYSKTEETHLRDSMHGAWERMRTIKGNGPFAEDLIIDIT